MKKKNAVILLLLAAALPVTGCTSKKDLENCQTENCELVNNYMTVKEQLVTAQARLTSLEGQLAQQERNYTDLHKSLDRSLLNTSSSNINISKLVDRVNKSSQYVHHLVEVESKSDSLSMTLTNSFTRSLSREELKKVDVQVLEGVVYIDLADNMLYRNGFYEINDRAAKTLSKIARIIMDCKDYDVLAEGDTDDMSVSQNSPLMKNTRNNWDLPTLRVSSVVWSLQSRYGVDPKRVVTDGRGEYNPLISNNTKLDKQRDHRTRIITTPKLDQFMDLIGKALENEGMVK